MGTISTRGNEQGCELREATAAQEQEEKKVGKRTVSLECGGSRLCEVKER